MYNQVLLSLAACGFLTACLQWNATNLSAQDAPVKPRTLAPGVLHVIEPDPDPRDAHSLPMKLPGVDAPQYDPNLDPATMTLHQQIQRVVMFRDVWQYEFAFLGLRQAELDIPQTNGQLKRKNIWYMVFRVRNVGKSLSHTKVQDPRFGHIDHELKIDGGDLDPVTMPDRFFGLFELVGWVEHPTTGEYSRTSYLDTIMPNAAAMIQKMEDPATQLLDTVQISKISLPPVAADTDQGGVWGVAIWDNVDPRIDYVSVFVHGLTNAFDISSRPGEISDPEEIQAGKLFDFKFKTLQLNFWRPGDHFDQANDEVTYGIPLVDDPNEQIAICQRYDLPGPIIQGLIQIPATSRRIQIFQLDGQVDPRTFNSTLATSLNEGTLPEEIRQAFSDAGFPLDGDPTLQTTIEGREWTLAATVGGTEQSFVLRMEPQYWEKSPTGGIRFIRSLDYLWVYR